MTQLEDIILSVMLGDNTLLTSDIPLHIKLMVNNIINHFNPEHVLRYPSLGRNNDIIHPTLELHKQTRYILDGEYDKVRYITEDIISHDSIKVHLKQLYNIRPDLFHDITYKNYPRLLPIMHCIKDDFIDRDDIKDIMYACKSKDYCKDISKYTLILYKHRFDVFNCRTILQYPADFVEYLIDVRPSRIKDVLKKNKPETYRNNKKIIRYLYQHGYIDEDYIIQHKLICIYGLLRYPIILDYDTGCRLIHDNSANRHYVYINDNTRDVYDALDFKNVIVVCNDIYKLYYLLTLHKGSVILEKQELDACFINKRFFDNTKIYRKIVDIMLNKDELSDVILRFIMNKYIMINGLYDISIITEY